MNLTSSRHADEFSRLLESDARTDDPVTGPLLALAEALRTVPIADEASAPRPEFRTALRQRLVAVATVQGVGAVETPMQRARAAGGTWKLQRRLTALAAGAAVVTGVSGVSLAASRSLPGDPLYGVKQAAESAQLATTVGTEARGKRHLEFARTRLSEVKSLADSGHTGLIIDTLQAMDVETRAGANDLFAAFRDSGSTEPLRALDRFTQTQYADLHTLLSTLPPAAQASARSSLALLAVIATDNVQTATGTTPGSTGGAPAPGGATPGATTPSTVPSASAQPSQSAGSGSTPAPSKSAPAPVTVPTAVPTAVPSVQAPTLPTIPPLPATSTLPTDVPTLPSDLTGLLGH